MLSFSSVLANLSVVTGIRRNDEQYREYCRDRPPCLSCTGVYMTEGRPRGAAPAQDALVL